MKILVIFTGGTIGCATNSEWISLDKSTNYALIDQYTSTFGDEIDFETLSPFSLLSENLSANELTQLVTCVNESASMDYDGIIITHGTDTIQYSAAALSYTLTNPNLPILLVSANYPLDSYESNAADNFEAAVAFVCQKAGKGVYVSYRNQNEKFVSFHYGTRLLSHVEAQDALYSLGDMLYAYYQNGLVIHNKDFIQAEKMHTEGNVVFCDEPKILVLQSYPGDSFHYDVTAYNAVILKPYHSGTLDVQNKALKHFCETAAHLGVPVFVVNLSDEISYESTKLYNELPFIQLPFCSFAAIYMKLWLAVSLSKELTDYIQQPMAGEFITKLR